MPNEGFTIGEVSSRSGVAASALRFYEQQGLIRSQRSAGGQRRYASDVLRRVAFIRVAQRVGVSLDEVRAALAELPDGRTPTRNDWRRLAEHWAPRLDAQIATLTRLRDQLDDCIGCGCLTLGSCALRNPHDAAASLGDGPRYLLGDTPADAGVVRRPPLRAAGPGRARAPGEGQPSGPAGRT